MLPIPAWLTWDLAKRILPYLGGLALILSAYWWADSRGREAQKAKDDKALSAITQQRDTWITAFDQSDANFRTAMSALNVQNADARKLADAYDKSKATDAANVAASNKRWEQTQKVLSGLQAVIGDDGGCKVDQRNVEALKSL